MASFLLYFGLTIVPLVTGGSIMPEFMVAIDHITYYAIQAEDEVTAIDLVLEGRGLKSTPRRAMPISLSISPVARDHPREPASRREPCVNPATPMSRP
jgi:hypothetical protein